VERITTKKLTDFPWLNLFNSTRILKDGSPVNWIFASRKKKQTKKEKNKPDAVIIIPVIEERSPYNDAQEGDYYLIMTKEYRIPIQQYEIGFPAGLIEEGDTIEETAHKELLEETGFEIKKIRHISPITYSSAGMTDESVVYVFCEVNGTPGKQNTEKYEDIEVLLLSQYDLVDFNKLGHFGSKAYAIVHMAKKCGIGTLL
jgi:ADP-ribose pyrophosphatase